MTNEPSPRPSALLPWSVEGPFPGERPTRKRDGFPAYANIVNRVGVYVSQNLRPDVAALIVDAVNGRAALSAVLRDMAKDCEAAWEGTPLRRALAKYFARLREIAGAGENPYGKGVG